jgi:flagellar capping protein FliD
MDGSTQLALSICIPTLAVLVGILINNSRMGDMNSRMGDMNSRLGDMSARLGDMNSRLDDLRADMDAKFDDMKDMWRSELHRVEEVLDARLRHLEER